MSERTLREKIAALEIWEGDDGRTSLVSLAAVLRLLDAAQPAPDAVAEAWREIEQDHQPRLADGYTAVRISRPGFWLVKGPGPATAFAKGSSA